MKTDIELAAEYRRNERPDLQSGVVIGEVIASAKKTSLSSKSLVLKTLGVSILTLWRSVNILNDEYCPKTHME